MRKWRHKIDSKIFNLVKKIIMSFFLKGLCQLESMRAEVRQITLERLRFTFTPNGRREFVPRDQVLPLFIASKQKQVVYASFNHRNRSGLFLSVYFLFWEILNYSIVFNARLSLSSPNLQKRFTNVLNLDNGYFDRIYGTFLLCLS